MSENILLTLLNERQELKNQVEELKARIEEIENGLKGEMDNRNADSLKVGAYNIFYKPIEKATFNSKSFGNDYPELKEKYTDIKTQLYFAIKC